MLFAYEVKLRTQEQRLGRSWWFRTKGIVFVVELDVGNGVPSVKVIGNEESDYRKGRCTDGTVGSHSPMLWVSIKLFCDVLPNADGVGVMILRFAQDVDVGDVKGVRKMPWGHRVVKVGLQVREVESVRMIGV